MGFQDQSQVNSAPWRDAMLFSPLDPKAGVWFCCAVCASHQKSKQIFPLADDDNDDGC